MAKVTTGKFNNSIFNAGRPIWVSIFLLVWQLHYDYDPKKKSVFDLKSVYVSQRGWLQQLQANSTTHCKKINLIDNFRFDYGDYIMISTPRYGDICKTILGFV